ncbi:nickel pincer cofactor biosynthesis protein LarC [Limnoglobus roseus]|uniref:Putative nickel insertion protein n=1 Tax=Limnoglobus roseus TaxID=2598579 RepID=A0A5C1AK75_9BACT|nr:nickel pincer cofactor biosynthesis protein LarC [Limnoglobus roseus]QEL17318.1 nickel pincer cofactor biosynthesis protein LarC [Limnoglobus roseus]
MRVAHFDCFSGVSGDMVLGAVIDAGVDPAAIRTVLESLGLPIQLEVEKVKRCGFAATKVTIHAEDQEDYRFLPDIEAILAKAALTPKQRELATTIFRKVAVAESVAHGMPLERVHFHEVGALDSIADIVGAAVGLDLLGVERFTASPVAVGSGTVKCAHGIMPVPTPGTAELLKGVPIAKCPVKGELATPTGVAILTSVVAEFVETPEMVIETIGHGAGTKDPIEQPNVLRLIVGKAQGRPSLGFLADTVTILETNLDDCPGEVIGYAMERLFTAGALDVFTQPIQMKKNRPGVLLTVICEPSRVPDLEAILFRETATFGVRRTTAARSKLSREAVTVETPWGPMKAKRGHAAGVAVLTPEYEDAARVAREQGVPLRDVYEAVRSAP